MSRVSEIRAAIEALGEDEYAQLRQWFSERDWQRWDEETEADSASGKQIQSHIRLAERKLGYWLNCGEALMKDGITRAVNGLEE